LPALPFGFSGVNTMKFKGPNHIFKCIPPVLGIRDRHDQYLTACRLAKQAGEKKPAKFEPVVFNLKAVTFNEKTELERKTVLLCDQYDSGKASEEIQQITMEFIAGKIDSIEGLEVDGKKVTTFEDFMSLAPIELIDWVLSAIYSTAVLSAAEVKN
jgi:hypothetical protein